MDPIQFLRQIAPFAGSAERQQAILDAVAVVESLKGRPMVLADEPEPGNE